MMKEFAYPKLLRYFEEISAIPRPSGHEERIAEYLVDFAQRKGFSYVRDEWNNVLIKAPATKGREAIAPVLLQGHTDMVCEKNAGIEHDFLSDPILLYEEDGWIRARGTTLGADNGVAVAMMLAILDGEAHPPLECLFTTSEEVGLDGAIAFDYSNVSARRMMNMDGADDTGIIVGSSGGVRTDLAVCGKKIAEKRPYMRLSVKGLMGGHSGEDIHRGRANANCLIGQLLAEISKEQTICLASIDGGSKDNAIPREAIAVFSVERTELAKAAVERLWQTIVPTLCADDAEANVLVEEFEENEVALACFDGALSKKLVEVLASVPNGVFAFEPTLPDLVQFSRNLGVVRTDGECVCLTFASRSAKDSQIEASLAELEKIAAKLGGTTHHHGRYPGWEVAEHSELQSYYAEVFRRLFQKELRIESIHAGLECGVIKQAIPDMDMLSCGPVIENLHSPDERLNCNSFERFFLLITEVLKDMK